MRLSLLASVMFVLGSALLVCVSPFDYPEDLEASGYELDYSGSGDDPEPVKNIEGVPKVNLVRVTTANPEKGNKDPVKIPSDLNLRKTHWPIGLSTSEYVVIKNGKGFMDYEEIVAGVIAGAITGAALGAALSAILICKRRKKHGEGCILSQKGSSDEDDSKPIRIEVI